MAFEIKRDDRRPYFRVQLTQNGEPVDLTGATAVRFTMKEGATLKIDGASMVAVDAATGVFEYQWANGDTDTVGDYSVEVEVDWGGSPAILQSFPSTGYFTLTINPDLS